MNSRLDIFKASKMEKTEADIPPKQVEGIVVDDEKQISREELQAALPAQLKIKVSDNLLDKVNQISMDPMIADEIRSNFIGYTHVLKDGKFKVEQYLEACAYVTYKMMGYNNQAAYSLTFPDRIRKMRSEGKDDKHISSFVSAYHKNKLVNIILEQAVIPSCILNQDMYQEALNHQAFLMINAKSEKVQTEAANSILNALKRPESSKIEIDLNVKDHSGIAELRDAMVQIAENQATRIRNGASTKEIAHTELFDKESKPAQ